MKNVKAGILLLLLLFLTSKPNFSAMANYTVGIKVGDWIKYDEKESHHLPEHVAGSNPPVYTSQALIRMEILEVSETNLTLCVTKRNSDGEETKQNFTGDIAKSSIDLWVIPANLTYEDSFNSIFGTITIDKEDTKTYAGASRTCVHAYTSGPVSLFVYWDKQTGVALDILIITSSTGYTSYVTYRATETNMWQAEFDTTILYVSAAAATVIAVGVIVVVIRRREVPTLPSPPPRVQPSPSKNES